MYIYTLLIHFKNNHVKRVLAEQDEPFQEKPAEITRFYDWFFNQSSQFFKMNYERGDEVFNRDEIRSFRCSQEFIEDKGRKDKEDKHKTKRTFYAYLKEKFNKVVEFLKKHKLTIQIVK